MGECSVCFETTEAATPCGHPLCDACRAAWYKRKPEAIKRTCPVCRQCIDGELRSVSLRVTRMGPSPKGGRKAGNAARPAPSSSIAFRTADGTTQVYRVTGDCGFVRNDVLVSMDGAHTPGAWVALRDVLERALREDATIQCVVLRKPPQKKPPRPRGWDLRRAWAYVTT